jgi:hypothetical protein
MTMASKVWEAMNDLSMVTTKICSAREIINAAVLALEAHQYDKAETLMEAANEFLEFYLIEYDTKFDIAWKQTVVPVNNLQYTDEELDGMCDAAEKQQNNVYESPDKGKTVYERQHGSSFRDIIIDENGVMPLPEDMMNQAGFSVGDYIQWDVQEDGNLKLKKVDNVSVIEKLN